MAKDATRKVGRVRGRNPACAERFTYEELWEPVGAGHGFFGFCGQILFLKATQSFFNGISGCFLDSLKNLVLSDAREIIRGGWLPPVGHVQTECSS